MRSTWTGMFGVSLLNIPVKLGSAVADNDMPVHQFDPATKSRIKYKRVSEADPDTEVAYADIVKGYETADGGVVFLTDADFEAAYGEPSKNARIITFTSPSAVPRIAAGKSYYVMPDKGGEKTYALLAGALQRAGKVAVIAIQFRQRENRAVLYPQDGYLVLELVEWAENVRRPDFPVPSAEIAKAEADMADQLIESMSGDYDYESQKDESQAKLSALVQSRIEHGGAAPRVAGAVNRPSGTSGEDLTALLQSAVQAQRKPAQKKTARKKASA